MNKLFQLQFPNSFEKEREQMINLKKNCGTYNTILSYGTTEQIFIKRFLKYFHWDDVTLRIKKILKTSP